jgi:acyl-coenzyme A synthetase/AMP-(fatty) acid ligase
VAAFVTGHDIDPAMVTSHMRLKLQAHAVPKTIRVLAEFPHNASGKVDRQALLEMLGG